jgi:hypothetical protein
MTAAFDISSVGPLVVMVLQHVVPSYVLIFQFEASVEAQA